MKKDLRIVFLGTPDFAVESLKAVVESGRNVVGVITAPDRKAGRGRKLQQSAVKKYAIAQNLPILQPTNLKSEAFLEELKAWNADIQIVVAFRMMPEVVWDMPPLGTFNLHASLLPKYRGAAPINWAIINGESESGVSTFFLKHEIDTGDILKQETVKIEADETAGSLHDKLMMIGAKLVVKSLQDIEAGNTKGIPQEQISEESDLPQAPKIFREDCEIDWQEDFQKIDLLIRGLSPYPAAWTTVKQQADSKSLNLKIYQVQKLESSKLEAGEMKVEGRQLLIGTKTEDLKVIELQIEGKRKMKTEELLNGFDLQAYKIVSL